MRLSISKVLAGTETEKHVNGGVTCQPIVLKRVRESASIDDGLRVLVDRLWPRGLTKEKVAVDLWLKEVAPSSALRRWYGHDPRRWTSFIEKYRSELEQRPELLRRLDDLCRNGRVTLVYDASDESRNNAVVLRDVLAERRFD
ncbi:DUF488 domain-containing protein [Variovorax sp. RA8]|uniref:DUF488 domain-containing protein n=1 Tax=Variovorax sp. (strain JCM 16519 / RA8) TaxID=662548 RepID=UPI000AE5C2EE|nr:DUF488 family protein [Variovorax sp. RA8]VTU44856.1 hypothetical protein RA8P2_00292 [Variovorax sp. RA8]